MTTKIFLTMPQPGETITAGTVVKWLVHAGASIKEKQIIVELETEKALFEFESPYEGVLTEIVADAGETIAVGNPIAIFAVDDEKASTYFMLGMGGMDLSQNISVPLPKSSFICPSPPEPLFKSSLPLWEGVRGRGDVRALSPLVRRLIKEKNISEETLASLQGTGPGGRITKQDILNFQPPDKSGAQVQDVEIIPCPPIRVRIAENMLRSKQTIPHAHTQLSVDLTQLYEYREANKASFKKARGIELGYLPLIFPVLKEAIQKFPLVNASFRSEAKKKEIAVFKNIHLGVAVDTEQGLTVPVLHHAEQMNDDGLAHALDALVKQAQAGRLKLDDLVGATFTFNNFGYFGTELGIQIIPPPQSATLGMGRLTKRPWVINDEIKIRWIADFTLAFDHRVLDGRDAGQFLMFLKEGLEKL